LDSDGHPKIRISAWGISRQLAKPFDAMIDTGFTGFLSLPFAEALPLGLTLQGTANFTLADGRLSPNLLTVGTIEVQNEELTGVIAIGNDPAAVLGMDFLRRSNKALLVSSRGVFLVDEADVEKGALALQEPSVTPSTGPSATGASNPLKATVIQSEQKN